MQRAQAFRCDMKVKAKAVPSYLDPDLQAYGNQPPKMAPMILCPEICTLV